MQVNFLTRYCQISASLPLTMLELVSTFTSVRSRTASVDLRLILRRKVETVHTVPCLFLNNI